MTTYNIVASTDESFRMVNTDVFLKYKNYFEAWLNIPVEKMEQSRSILVSSDEKKNTDQAAGCFICPCAPLKQKALYLCHAFLNGKKNCKVC